MDSIELNLIIDTILMNYNEFEYHFRLVFKAIEEKVRKYLDTKY